MQGRVRALLAAPTGKENGPEADQERSTRRDYISDLTRPLLSQLLGMDETEYQKWMKTMRYTDTFEDC